MNLVNKIFIVFSLIICVISVIHGQRIDEKTIKAAKVVNETCLKLARTDKVGCEFFKCLEDRFPCGPQYWTMRWGIKYCKKYNDPSIVKTFTVEGQELLNYTYSCITKNLEKTYKSKAPMKCKRFYDNAFKIQGKCYKDVYEKFCRTFPENKNQFLKSVDAQDYMDANFLPMIRGVLSLCNPPLDLFKLIFAP